jgi:predicted ABC-type transport system involved in lysophospholipase L1 biosynthesis ATPase subunit
VVPAWTEAALQIIGREHELEVLTAAVDAAAEAGRTVAVCGEPGIGKSVLIEAAARRGQERGYLVLRSTGVGAVNQHHAGLGASEVMGCPPTFGAGHGLIMGSRIADCHQSDDSLC